MKTAIASLLVGLACLSEPALFASSGGTARDPSVSLQFDASRFKDETVTVDGRAVAYRAYEGIVYVANPVDAKYQRLNFYVPAAYIEGKGIGAFTAETAPLFLPNSVGGYMPGEPGTPGLDRQGRTNAIAAALARGFVVAAAGARGRTLKDASGLYTGKAPAAIVDLKAAVRYLRFNDAAMAGSAERIVSNGTSAGGALSALLGATGNAADYEPFLLALGAAPARDDIYAASCYCPITNLEHADAAYEWLFNGVTTYRQRTGEGTLDATQIALSADLKASFPAYVNSLGLRGDDGAPLGVDAAGEGTLPQVVKSLLIASAQKAFDAGTDLSGLDWLVVSSGRVVDADLKRYVVFATRMKTPPAFDGLEGRSPENGLFGTATVDSRHFTDFSSERGAVVGRAEATLVKMMNPMDYIGAEGVVSARYWRIRHGAIDRDTSLAVPVLLAAKLKNNGLAVDLEFPWGLGHSGDYDLNEMFAWIEGVTLKP